MAAHGRPWPPMAAQAAQALHSLCVAGPADPADPQCLQIPPLPSLGRHFGEMPPHGHRVHHGAHGDHVHCAQIKILLGARSPEPGARSREGPPRSVRARLRRVGGKSPLPPDG